MTLPQNVADAVKSVRKHFDLSMDDATCEAWQTIRAHLMSQEAEIARVKSIADAHCDGRLTAIDRLAAANALLRECYEWLFESLSDGPRVSEGAIEKHYYTPLLEAFHGRIQTHLQGAGDE